VIGGSARSPQTQGAFGLRTARRFGQHRGSWHGPRLRAQVDAHSEREDGRSDRRYPPGHDV